MDHLGATNSGQPKHSADLRRTAPTWPDDHLMGPIWEIPPDRSSAEAAAGSPAGAASYQFMDEDEMASWLNCEIGEAGGGSVQGWMAEGFEAAPSAADSKGPIKSGSKRKEAEVSMMRPSSPASAERKRLKACEAEAVQEHGCRRALQPNNLLLSLRYRRKQNSKIRKDPEVEYGERRKQARECGSVRKLRVMEIHKLSERKRRDKINAKMKVLQELIPSCRKPDKESTLDEAIQYMKSLQLQVQMMSVRCNASPLLFPGMRPFFSPIGLGMQMGLGMDLGMTTGMEFAHGCSMLPFGQLPHPAIGGYRPVHFGARTLPLLFPPAVPAANQVGDEAINLLNHLLDPRRSSDVVQIPPFSEPYRWFLSTACSQVQPQSEVFEESPINTSNASAGSHNRLEG